MGLLVYLPCLQPGTWWDLSPCFSGMHGLCLYLVPAPPAMQLEWDDFCTI